MSTRPIIEERNRVRKARCRPTSATTTDDILGTSNPNAGTGVSAGERWRGLVPWGGLMRLAELRAKLCTCRLHRAGLALQNDLRQAICTRAFRKCNIGVLD